MKKNQTMQGTFSKLFGKKHANPATTSLYATNPPWIFTQEAQEEGPRDFGECTPGGKKKAREKSRRRLFPPDSGVTWALGRRAGAGTRWNLRTGQGDAGKGEEASQPESERDPLKRGRRTSPPSPAIPAPSQPLVGFVAVFPVSPTPPHIRILSESEVILRSRHLSLTLSASSAPQRACLRCPVFRSVWVRKVSDNQGHC